MLYQIVFQCEEGRVTRWLFISMIIRKVKNVINREIQWKRCSIPILMLILIAAKRTDKTEILVHTAGVCLRIFTCKWLSVGLYKGEENHQMTLFHNFLFWLMIYIRIVRQKAVSPCQNRRAKGTRKMSLRKRSNW